MTMLTEDEAMAYDCIGPEGCGYLIETGAGTWLRRCAGSRCGMGWRWGPGPAIQIVILDVGVTPDGEGWVAGETKSWAKTTKEDPLGMRPNPEMVDRTFWTRPTPGRRGFCGLAGKP